MKFLKFRLIPTTHTTTVSQVRLILLYAIVKGLTIDVRKLLNRILETVLQRNRKEDCDG